MQFLAKSQVSKKSIVYRRTSLKICFVGIKRGKTWWFWMNCKLWITKKKPSPCSPQPPIGQTTPPHKKISTVRTVPPFPTSTSGTRGLCIGTRLLQKCFCNFSGSHLCETITSGVRHIHRRTINWWRTPRKDRSGDGFSEPQKIYNPIEFPENHMNQSRLTPGNVNFHLTYKLHIKAPCEFSRV